MSDHLSAMYGVENEEEEKVSRTIMRPVENRNAKTRRINVGIVGYDVPAVDHVAMLEKRIEAMEQMYREQTTKMRRMESIIVKLRSDLLRVNGSVTGFTRELDNKIDRRGD
jgi:hypothetical protein